MTYSEDIHASRGPVSTMPGSEHTLPMGTLCDVHADRPAIKRIQTETDSFGCEYACMCSECFDEYRKYQAEQLTAEQTCDWCKKRKTDCRHRRDYDEGMSGPVYLVCADCRKRNDEALAAEAASYHDDYDDDEE